MGTFSLSSDTVKLSFDGIIENRQSRALNSGCVRAKLSSMSLSLTHRKATQALNFLARQSGGRINKLKALKLMFFADRYHLRKFGRPVSECAYYAMTHGPVASEAKQVAEDASLL